MEESSSVFSESPFGTQSSSSSSNNQKGKLGKRGKKLIFLVIILIILAAIAFGAMQLLGNTSDTQDAEPTPTIEEFILPTDTPTPEQDEISPSTTGGTTPSPTGSSTGSSSSVDPVTKLDRSDLTILVQNGSGEAGVAGVMKDKLEDLGYVVSSTGNADNFDYAETVIQVKTANKAFLPLLQKDLGDDYTIGSATSDYTGSADAVVIVGAE